MAKSVLFCRRVGFLFIVLYKYFFIAISFSALVVVWLLGASRNGRRKIKANNVRE